MSVIVTVRINVDPDEFRRVEQTRPDDFRGVSEAARAAGCLHLRFGFGTGEVVVIDEWSSAEAFQQFFENPTIASLMADAGVQGPPEVEMFEAVTTVDQF